MIKTIKKKRKEGVSDMTLLTLYRKDFPDSIKDGASMNNGSCFDDNISMFRYIENFKSLKDIYFMPKIVNNIKIKEVIIKDKKSFCRGKDGKLIKFNSLHFQGGAKKIIKLYFYKLNKDKYWDKIKDDISSLLDHKLKARDIRRFLFQIKIKKDKKIIKILGIYLLRKIK